MRHDPYDRLKAADGCLHQLDTTILKGAFMLKQDNMSLLRLCAEGLYVILFFVLFFAGLLPQLLWNPLGVFFQYRWNPACDSRAGRVARFNVRVCREMQAMAAHRNHANTTRVACPV